MTNTSGIPRKLVFVLLRHRSSPSVRTASFDAGCGGENHRIVGHHQSALGDPALSWRSLFRLPQQFSRAKIQRHQTARVVEAHSPILDGQGEIRDGWDRVAPQDASGPDVDRHDRLAALGGRRVTNACDQDLLAEHDFFGRTCLGEFA
jgi:hypothetical protein